jgi:hypothetical protein
VRCADRARSDGDAAVRRAEVIGGLATKDTVGTPHLCRPTHRRGDSDRPGAVTSSPVGGMTALLACSRALRGAPE